MFAEHLDRKALKWETRELFRDAQVSPKAMTALYFGIGILVSIVKSLAGGAGFFATFIDILASFFTSVLGAGFILYCMAIRRGERSEYLTLFDGFTFVGKIILLEIVTSIFIFLWALLFIIPGIVAMYRYQFALYNLCENPRLGVMEALNMSKLQTQGYKSQLFMLDLSYLGWTLLALLPGIIEIALLYRAAFQIMAMDPMSYYLMSDSELTAMVFGGIPSVAIVLFLSLWSLVVSLFFYPNRTCVYLAYFDAAKHTSGIGDLGGEGDSTRRLEDNGWNGL